MRLQLELPVVVVLRVRKETREGGHGCRPLTGHDGRDASGHAQAGGRSMATERSESWPVRIAPSAGHEAALNREFTVFSFQCSAMRGTVSIWESPAALPVALRAD